MTLAEQIAPWATQWPSADRAASARVKALNLRLRSAMPVATQELLHAMCLHLALRATLRRYGSGSGSPPPDLSAVIAQAASAMTPTERQALKRHLEEPKGWFAWARSQLLRPGEKGTIARKQQVAAETDVERLLASVRKALNSPAPRRPPGTATNAAEVRGSRGVDQAGQQAAQEVQALLKAAREIRTPGHWFGLGGDLAPHLITSMPGWPKDLSLRIEDKTGKRAPLEFGQSGPGRAPVIVQLDHARQHYSPVVDGRLRAVPAKGDCFYESVLRAMTVADQRALFNGMRFPRGAGIADLIRDMRRQVADELERQVDAPDGPSDDLRAYVAAAR